jgi:RimJ/RimL family protein N-acetyltransferase
MSLNPKCYVESSDNMIQLVYYEEKYQSQLFDFKLPPDQHQFTGLPREVLDISISDPNRYPIVIINGEVAVGFFVFHQGEDISPFSTNPNAILLRAFSIHNVHQGNGYGKTAMKLLPIFVKKNFPNVDEIVLAVNEKNNAAKKLYESVGFIDLGERRIGNIGSQYLLHFLLNK